MSDEISYDDLAAGNAVPSNEQTVADETPASPGVEADNARQEPDLDELLRQFDQAQQQPQPDLSAELERARAAAQHDHWRADYAEQQANQAIQQAQQERDLRDARELIKEIKADLPIQDQAVGYFLDGQLLAHPELMQVWQNRSADPATFERARSHLARELHKTFSRLPDPELTETKAIVSHAVRGASTAIPPDEPAPNLGMMDDQTYRRWVRQNLGFDAGV